MLRPKAIYSRLIAWFRPARLQFATLMTPESPNAILNRQTNALSPQVRAELTELKQTFFFDLLIQVTINRLDGLIQRMDTMRDFKSNSPASKLKLKTTQEELEKVLTSLFYNVYFNGKLDVLLSLFRLCRMLKVADSAIYNRLFNAFVSAKAVEDPRLASMFFEAWNEQFKPSKKGLVELPGAANDLNSQLIQLEFLTVGAKFDEFFAALACRLESGPDLIDKADLLDLLIISLKVFKQSARFNANIENQKNLILNAFMPIEIRLLQLLVKNPGKPSLLDKYELIELMIDQTLIISVPATTAALKVLFGQIWQKSDENTKKGLIYRLVRIMGRLGFYDNDIAKKYILPFFDSPTASFLMTFTLLDYFSRTEFNDPTIVNRVLAKFAADKAALKHHNSTPENQIPQLGSVLRVHNVLEYFLNLPDHEQFVKEQFSDWIFVGRRHCVLAQYNTESSWKAFPQTLDCRQSAENAFLVVGSPLRQWTSITIPTSEVSNLESFLFQAIASHFNDIFRKYTISVYFNYPFCVYSIDVFIEVKELDLQIAVEFRGSVYSFRNNTSVGTSQRKFGKIRRAGIILVELENDFVFADIIKALDYRRAAELTAFSIDLEVQNTRGFNLELNFRT